MAPSNRLEVGQWNPEVRRELNAWLEEVSTRETAEPKVATFDFDNTTISKDISFAVMDLMMSELSFRFTPEELRSFLRDEINGIGTSAHGVVFKDVNQDILEAYEQLWPAMKAGRVADVLESEAHQNFRAKFSRLYDLLEETPGIGAAYAYPWFTYAFAGYDGQELQSLARRGYRRSSHQPCRLETWTSATPGRSGHMSYSFEQGLARQPELIDLMDKLRRAGVDVYIVTASLEDLVKGAVSELGYPLKESNIYGMRLLKNEQGVCLPRAPELADYPVTNGVGKVELIDRFLPARPLLVGGDSDGDEPMLSLDTTEVRLVFNRNKAFGKITALYRDAEEKPAMSTPRGFRIRTLLQGRDENHACLVPQRKTIPLPK